MIQSINRGAPAALSPHGNPEEHYQFNRYPNFPFAEMAIVPNPEFIALCLYSGHVTVRGAQPQETKGRAAQPGV